MKNPLQHMNKFEIHNLKFEFKLDKFFKFKFSNLLNSRRRRKLRLIQTRLEHSREISNFKPVSSIVERFRITQEGFIRFTKKTLVTYLIIFMAFSGTGLVFLFNPFGTKSADAAWFNDNWGYRKEIPVTANTGVDTNTYISFSLDTATLITAGQLQSSCQDIRVTDVGGNILAYHIGRTNACNNAATTIDALVPTLAADASIFYVYYGNPAVASKDQGAFTQSEAATYTIGTLGSAVLAPSPTLYWKFDEAQGTNAEDSTTNGLDGTLSNGPAYQTENFCISSKCLYFAGTDDNVNKADDAKLDFAAADNFTISAWVKRNGAASANTVILQKSGANIGSTYTGYKMYMDASGDFCFDIQDGTNAVDTACTSAVDFDDNQWHFVSGVKAATTSVTLYVDGKQRAQDASVASTGTLANASTFRVGADSDGLANEWLGFVDEVKIVRDQTARTAAQVLADYNARSNPEGVSAALGANTQNMPGALSNGLVGYWKMDEASDATRADSSGNGNTLTESTADTITLVAGKFDGAGDFELGQTEYLFVADSASLSVTGSLTLSAWIKPETVSAGSYNIFGKWDGADESYRLFQNGDEVRLELDTAGNYVETSSSNLAAGTWYHIVGVYNSSNSTAKIYINGVEATSSTTGTLPSSIGDDAGRFQIGAEDTTGGATGYYDGIIDDSRIYNRTLSPAEVAQLYNWAPGPVGYWKMDENTGTNTTDSSGSDNNGTWNGTTTSIWKPGKYGSAGNFNGTNNSITVASHNNFPTTNATYGLWVYLNSLASTTALMSSADGTNDQFYLLVNTDGTIQYSPTGNNGGGNITSSGSITANAWYHISAVRDNNTMSIYINGVKDSATGTNSQTINYTSVCATYIGASDNTNCNDPTWGPTNGKIDEAKIYNYARSQGQVVEDMNAGHPAPGSPVGTPLGYWKFDEGADNKCSGGSNDACNSGSPGSTLDGANTGGTRTLNGKFGGAYDFGGDSDEIDAGSPTALDDLASLTVSGWFYTDDTGGTSNYRNVISKANNSTPANGWAVFVYDGDGGGPRLEFWADHATNEVYRFTTEGAIATGVWQHWAITWDGTTSGTGIKIYINGKETGYHTTANGVGARVSDASYNLVIGNIHTNEPANGFDGKMDEIKIYGQVLTADQVKLDMNRGQAQVMGAMSDSSTAGNDNASTRTANSAASEYCIPGDSSTCTAPVGRWDLEEGVNTTAFDSSGNGNDLTLTNSPSYAVGKVGKGVVFTASTSDNDHLFRADDADFDFGAGASFTLEGWFKIDNPPSSGASYLITKFNEAGYAIYYSDTNSLMACGIDYDSTFSPTDKSEVTFVTDGKWHHVACVKNANTSLTLYLDGVPATADTSLTNSTLANSDPLYIGINEAGTGSDLSGTSDQISIFNYPRTAAQIAWDYNKGKPIAHWKMDECQGTTLNNSINSSFAGTLTATSTVGTCNTSSTFWGGSGGTGSGKRNYAPTFNGTGDYMTIANASSLPANNASQTLSAWFYYTSTPSGVDDILALTNTASSSITVLQARGSTLGAYKWAGSALVTTSAPSTNAWHNITYTYDGTTNSLYIDGRLVTTSVTAPNTATPTGAFISDYTTAGGEFWQGLLDDVRIYNYALTTTQVKTLYNEGATRYGPSTGAP